MAPSRARWSQVSVIVIIGAHDELAVARDRPLLDRADGEDRRLRRVEHGDELLDAVHAEVRDRERAALEVAPAAASRRARARRGRPARPRSPRSSGARRPRITGTTRPSGIATASPTFGARVQLDRVAGEEGVDGAVAHERDGAGLGEHVGDGRLRGRPRRLDEPLAELQRPRHVGGHRDLERRRLPRLGEPARDRAAHRGERLDLDLAGRSGAGTAAAAAPASARSTSSATMRPSGPVPESAARSIPRSRAIRRASGEALTRPPSRIAGGLLLSALGRAAASALALASRGRARRALLRRVRLDLCARSAVSAHVGRYLLALLADDGDRLADRHLALLHRDLQQHAGGLGLDLLRHLVGVELVERLALLDGSPSDLSHRTIVPDSMPWPSRGSLTSSAMAPPAEYQ